MKLILMAISYLTLLTLSMIFPSPNIISATRTDTNFTCSSDSPPTCKTYITYRARSPYMDLGNISDLFGISRLSIAYATNLTSENEKILYDQLLLIPITSNCNNNRYLSNVTYQIKKEDSFYVVATSVFQNLTDYHTAESKTNLTVGEEVVFPLFCKCPAQLQNQDQYLITYVWQPEDEILHVSSMFNTSSYDIVKENSFRNFTAAVCLPVVIPVSKLPIFPPPHHLSVSRIGHSNRLTYTLDEIEGPLEVSPNGTIKFEEKDGIDYAVVTVQLPGGERALFLFTIKQLVASGTPDNFGGEFLVPSYRGSSFLDPKGRGGSTGYDNAVALPAGGRGDEEELAKENVKNTASSTGKITLSVTSSKPDTGEVIGVFESIQPSDTDLGAKAPKDVKIQGVWYAQLE
ncbi:hypothetical protein E3N88_12498 [Mikania micrantha]|uniref:Oxygen-evolving enhancer protein 1, chloroplastic n=1 Tax=Mikania micrantha TaxID=192012 RepID=A0A5N6P711_9ASTR|nr:hypothetical protein E3N88_12498 [Mikania micrantha]